MVFMPRPKWSMSGTGLTLTHVTVDCTVLAHVNMLIITDTVRVTILNIRVLVPVT